MRCFRQHRTNPCASATALGGAPRCTWHDAVACFGEIDLRVQAGCGLMLRSHLRMLTGVAKLTAQRSAPRNRAPRPEPNSRLTSHSRQTLIGLQRVGRSGTDACTVLAFPWSDAQPTDRPADQQLGGAGDPLCGDPSSNHARDSRGGGPDLVPANVDGRGHVRSTRSFSLRFPSRSGRLASDRTIRSFAHTGYVLTSPVAAPLTPSSTCLPVPPCADSW